MNGIPKHTARHLLLMTTTKISNEIWLAFSYNNGYDVAVIVLGCSSDEWSTRFNDFFTIHRRLFLKVNRKVNDPFNDQYYQSSSCLLVYAIKLSIDFGIDILTWTDSAHIKLLLLYEQNDWGQLCHSPQLFVYYNNRFFLLFLMRFSFMELKWQRACKAKKNILSVFLFYFMWVL